MRRRTFLKASAALGVNTLVSRSIAADGLKKPRFRMPEEAMLHAKTWFAFGAQKSIWGGRLLPVVQKNLVDIINRVALYEPVSVLVDPLSKPIATKLLTGDAVLIDCPMDDIWIRDTGPLFVEGIDLEGQFGVDFNFNGWGDKQDHDRDGAIAGKILNQVNVGLAGTFLVIEGGAIEVDGAGTGIFTESCILNNNRNPGLSKLECEKELKRILGLENIIWLPGIAGMDITDGHTDFYARFVEPGVVIAAYDSDPNSFDHDVTKAHLEILNQTVDARGRKLDVRVLETPWDVRTRYLTDDFAAGYVNYYVCNGAVMMPEFGDKKADERAKSILQASYPDRIIEQINIDGIVAGGGGIHCVTQQQPA
ncbi:agmatine deiminase family protein [Bermanella marisrubri]|uniref:agmatine deiminase family protein n=1 Tax=Bermanella marisrubri TaxID=207949 RepID=UPI001442DBA7|nr:agmatine deiminase family protein [Bermanella marisrubri]QIZ84265.1 agmatine deiminase family protein [Bermanella marisrubri]